MVYPIGMAVNLDRAYDELRALIDNVARGSDTPTRLRTLVALDHEWRRIIGPARDEAAYEGRRHYSRADLAMLTGHSDQQIVYWARRHQQRTGAPALGPIQRIDLSQALDLTHRPVIGE